MQAKERKRLKEQGETSDDQVANHVKITIAPTQNPPWTNAADGKLVLTHGDDSFDCKDVSEKLPKLKYTISVADIDYGLDDKEEEITMGDVSKLVNTFQVATTPVYWVIITFCSFKQTQGLFETLDKVCNLGVEHHFWHIKLNTLPSVHKYKAANEVEHFLVGVGGHP